MKTRELIYGDFFKDSESDDIVMFIALDMEAPESRCWVKIKNGIRGWSMVDLIPIELNQEWLIIFEYEFVEYHLMWFHKQHAILNYEGYKCFKPFNTHDKDCWIPIHYVHELQNLHNIFDNNPKKRTK